MKLLIGHWYENPNAAFSKDSVEMPLGVRALLAAYRLDYTG